MIVAGLVLLIDGYGGGWDWDYWRGIGTSQRMISTTRRCTCTTRTTTCTTRID